MLADSDQRGSDLQEGRLYFIVYVVNVVIFADHFPKEQCLGANILLNSLFAD